MPSSAMRQPILPFDAVPPAPAGVLEAQACERARRLLAAWRRWPGRALVLAGGDAATRAALAREWMEAAEGLSWQAGTPCPEAPAIWVEGQGHDTGALFALLSQAEAGETFVLITDDVAPRHWDTVLSDLRSRLLSLPVELLPAPDTAFLERLLAAHLLHLRIEPVPAALKWLAERIAPDYASPRAVAMALADVTGLSRRPGRQELAAALALAPAEASAQAGFGGDFEADSEPVRGAEHS